MNEEKVTVELSAMGWHACTLKAVSPRQVAGRSLILFIVSCGNCQQWVSRSRCDSLSKEIAKLSGESESA